jgi:DNA replication protein DnaC
VVNPFDKILAEIREHMPKTPEEWAAHDARVAAQRALEASQRRAHVGERLLTKLVEAGLSKRHTLEVLGGTAKPTPALDAARRCRDEKAIWVLTGGVGCGKTFAAHWWLLSKWPGAGAIIPDRLGFATAHEFTRASRYGEKFDRLTAPDRLVIDDFGAEYADEKGSFLADFDALLDARWRMGKPTMMTTNMLREQFTKRYGARITDRVRGEDGWFNVSGPSLRGER